MKRMSVSVINVCNPQLSGTPHPHFEGGIKQGTWNRRSIRQHHGSEAFGGGGEKRPRTKRAARRMVEVANRKGEGERVECSMCGIDGWLCRVKGYVLHWICKQYGFDSKEMMNE